MINQITIEGYLTEDAKIVDSKKNKEVCFVNFNFVSNKSYMKNNNWENIPFHFDASYLTAKDNLILKRMVKDSHVLITGSLVQEKFNNKNKVKIKCTQIGLLPRINQFSNSQSNNRNSSKR